MTLTVAFVAEGDANTANCWSGSGRSFIQALRRAAVTVHVIDAEMTGLAGWVAAACALHPDRARWRQRFQLGPASFRLRSSQVTTALRRLPVAVDAVIQVGATFRVDRPARREAAYVAYCDSNIRYALRGRPYSGASHLAPTDLGGIIDRETGLYGEVDRIWTMSEALAQSFRDDFDQPASKLHTIYAGANNPPPQDPPARPVPGAPPAVLFIGKDHVRKGSSMLLEAFSRVRQSLPIAELHLVGAIPPGSDAPGVKAHGFLSHDREGDRQLLADLYSKATVFCMPSHYEPFGIVFVEAMLAGLPCIGTRAWAMPEIIRDRQTGWLVPDGSVEDLTARLLEALRDPEGAARLGRAGREHALANFTWGRVAARAVEDLTQLLSRRR